ncbi:MAG TPA: 2Fe-2S iron-sulfur cluster-binding protein, partial [Acinetobacter sp.]|nr:2Fe-2S iron-sulfur cluster-binding protein [Acinetobacter sp.]
MERLLDVLREKGEWTGVKEGCGEGECGACAVMIDGELVNSCLVPISQANGAEILTVEGLSLSKDKMSAIQESFLKHGGAQCGFCTPGMLMA